MVLAMPSPLPFDPIEEAGRQWRKRWGASPLAPMMAVTSVMRVQQVWLARLNEALEPFGLTFARYEALMLLYFSRAGSLPLGKMGRRLQVHPTSVTNLVDGLEKRGYVERTPHPSDRRTTLASITGPGRGRRRARDGGAPRDPLRDPPMGKADLEALTGLLRGARAAAGDFAQE